jgi:hypothetical protein
MQCVSFMCILNNRRQGPHSSRIGCLDDLDFVCTKIMLMCSCELIDVFRCQFLYTSQTCMHVYLDTALTETPTGQKHLDHSSYDISTGASICTPYSRLHRMQELPICLCLPSFNGLDEAERHCPSKRGL